MVHDHPCLSCGDPCDCNEQNPDDCGLCSYCETESLSDSDMLLEVDDPSDWLPEEDYGYRDDEGGFE